MKENEDQTWTLDGLNSPFFSVGKSRPVQNLAS